MKLRLNLLGIGFLLVISGTAWSESAHVWGVHSWAPGCVVDVMGGHPGWTVEYADSHGSPHVVDLEKMKGEGFTILQRLDYDLNQTMPVNQSQRDQFAADCARWVRTTKPYIRHFLLGNEMELFGMGATDYIPAFQQAYAAMKAERSDVMVIIGMFTNSNNYQAVIDAVGVNGYDGISVHTSNHVDTGFLTMLDQKGARPGVGVYITEWGWVGSTVPQHTACQRMQTFYNNITSVNQSFTRQIYCATWYVYNQQTGPNFALQNHPVEKHCFSEQSARHSAFNDFKNNAITISNPRVAIGQGNAVELSWLTNRPSTTQAFYRVHGENIGLTTRLDQNLTTEHTVALFPLESGNVYDFIAVSTGWGLGDVTSGIIKFYAAPWSVDKTNISSDRATITWSTPFQGTSTVRYGTTEALGQTAGTTSARTTNHSVTLTGLLPDTIYFFKAESDPQQSGLALHESALNAFITSSQTDPTPTVAPVPTMTPAPPFCMGDANRDGFVNAEDYRSVRNHFGQQTDGEGDANGDGFVNAEDYRVVRNHFGQSCD